jgi:acetolactate synthase-1/2/3 large subunit
VQPHETARVAHIGKDVLYQRYPMRSHRSDLSLEADFVATLSEVDSLLGDCAPATESDWLNGCSQSAPPPSAATLNHRYVSQCLNAMLQDEDAVLFNEYPFTLEDINSNRPGQYYAHSPAGGLGWAMGACMGYRLNKPDAMCIAAVGDGAYMFGEPTPSHFVSRARALPFITVIYNNRRWAAVHRATLTMYPDGAAAAMEEPMFATLEPAPDYEKIVEASGGLGIRVSHASELPAALQRARHAVMVEKRQAVINVLTEISYGRTS